MTIHPTLRAIPTGYAKPESQLFFQTSKFAFNPQHGTECYETIARELSLATGRKIEFCYVQDNDCSVWGDFGSFIIK